MDMQPRWIIKMVKRRSEGVITMSNCEKCKYYKVIFSEILRRKVPACCLPVGTKEKCKYCNRSKK